MKSALSALISRFHNSNVTRMRASADAQPHSAVALKARSGTVAAVAKASLCGFGVIGYALAIDGLAALIGARRKS